MNETKPFTISRVFNAPLALVYQVYTEPQHLAQWMGPAGSTVIKADQDFRVGGIHHYGLKLADGSEMWGKQVYLEIIPQEKIVYLQSFSDPNGAVTRHPMAATWPLEMHSTTTFTAEDQKTRLTITWYPYNSDVAGNATFDGARDGMTGGFTGMFATLESYLERLT